MKEVSYRYFGEVVVISDAVAYRGWGVGVLNPPPPRNSEVLF